MRRTVTLPPPGISLARIARRVSYVGSPEHKDHPSFAGRPRPRADASLCDPALAHRLPDLTRWLRAAIRKGNVGAPWEGDFPRYAWHRQGDAYFEARLVNREKGEYKGYPLADGERPDGLR
jgi:hypothetical protein